MGKVIKGVELSSGRDTINWRQRTDRGETIEISKVLAKKLGLPFTFTDKGNMQILTIEGFDDKFSTIKGK